MRTVLQSFLDEPDSSLFIGRLTIGRLALHQIERNSSGFFFTEVRGEFREQLCSSWLPRAVDFKVLVSCSQIHVPRRAFAAFRTHGPLVESPTS
jgi:hypothetical protein